MRQRNKRPRARQSNAAKIRTIWKKHIAGSRPGQATDLHSLLDQLHELVLRGDGAGASLAARLAADMCNKEAA